MQFMLTSAEMPHLIRPLWKLEYLWKLIHLTNLWRSHTKTSYWLQCQHNTVQCVHDMTNQKQTDPYNACKRSFTVKHQLHIFLLSLERSQTEFPATPDGQKALRQQPIKAIPQRTHSIIYNKRHQRSYNPMYSNIHDNTKVKILQMTLFV